MHINVSLVPYISTRHQHYRSLLNISYKSNIWTIIRYC